MIRKFEGSSSATSSSPADHRPRRRDSRCPGCWNCARWIRCSCRRTRCRKTTGSDEAHSGKATNGGLKPRSGAGRARGCRWPIGRRRSVEGRAPAARWTDACRQPVEDARRRRPWKAWPAVPSEPKPLAPPAPGVAGEARRWANRSCSAALVGLPFLWTRRRSCPRAGAGHLALHRLLF
jgi:hypothetical protein